MKKASCVASSIKQAAFIVLAVAVQVPMCAMAYERISCRPNEARCTSGGELPSVEFCFRASAGFSYPIPSHLNGQADVKGYNIDLFTNVAHLDAIQTMRGAAVGTHFRASIDRPQQPTERTLNSIEVIVSCEFPR